MNAHALTSLCTAIRIYPLIILFYYFRGIGSSGWSYTGGYKQGNGNGKGEEEWADGSRQIAYYVDDKKEGAAKFYDENGKEEDRFYKNDRLVDDSGNFIDSDSSDDSEDSED